MTTSFKISYPAPRNRSANNFANLHVRSIKSRKPLLPSDFIAAHNSTPRARRDDSGTWYVGSRKLPACKYAADIPMDRFNAIPSRTRTTPQSYPAFGHLCASVAQESASSKPRVNSSNFGETRAHNPNAPSTCTHAPTSFTRLQISSAGSKAPVFTFPAWIHTMVREEILLGNLSVRIRPCASVGTRVTRFFPSPTMLSA